MQHAIWLYLNYKDLMSDFFCDRVQKQVKKHTNRASQQRKAMSHASRAIQTLFFHRLLSVGTLPVV